MTLIGILPCLGEGESGDSCFVLDGIIKWLAVLMVSAEMLNFNLLSTQAETSNFSYIYTSAPACPFLFCVHFVAQCDKIFFKCLKVLSSEMDPVEIGLNQKIFFKGSVAAGF